MSDKNPWNIFDAYNPMFCDKITVIGKRPNHQTLSCACNACVFPPSTIQILTEDAEETDILKQKILIKRNGSLSCDFEPKVGDRVITDENTMYINGTETKHEWYDIEVRSRR